MKIKLKIVLLCLGVAFVLSIGTYAALQYIYNSFATTSQTYRVVLTNSGFQPSELTVHKNDVVIFSTDRGFPFWPASDKHPSHSIYPEFDPKQPIVPDDTWEFEFAAVGNWAYHDHLNSTLRGVIYVTE